MPWPAQPKSPRRWSCKVVAELFNNRIVKGCPQRPAQKDRPQVPQLGAFLFCRQSGDTPCEFAGDFVICRRASAHSSTFAIVLLCSFCGGCGHLAQKGGLAVYVYLRFCCGALIRSSVPSSVWLASGLQSKAYLARACLGCSPSS